MCEDKARPDLIHHIMYQSNLSSLKLKINRKFQENCYWDKMLNLNWDSSVDVDWLVIVISRAPPALGPPPPAMTGALCGQFTKIYQIYLNTGSVSSSQMLLCYNKCQKKSRSSRDSGQSRQHVFRDSFLLRRCYDATKVLLIKFGVSITYVFILEIRSLRSRWWLLKICFLLCFKALTAVISWNSRQN